MAKIVKHLQKIVIIAVLSMSLASCSTSQTNLSQSRPAQWASPIQKQGLPNFYKVTDDLYRGAQPDIEGIAELKNMGIKTILDLRANHSDKSIIGDIDMFCEHIEMQAWDAKEVDTIKFLQIVTDKSKTPVFVHCQRGADRTGYMCAVYRVAVCGWTKEDAINEMVNGGYNFSPLWQNLKNSVMKLNVEDIRLKAGMANIAKAN